MKKLSFISQYPIRAIFLLLLLTAACEGNPWKLYPVQGKWRIDLVKIQTIEEGDSVASGNLGYLVFNDCENDSNMYYACYGQRIYPDGKKIDFPFSTMVGAADEHGKGEGRLDMGRKTERSHELSGLFKIKKLTNSKMVLMANRCQIGDMLIDTLELHATKAGQ